MKTIKFLLLSLTILAFVSCGDDDNKIKLPKATNTGANTFGCLVDKKPYVGGAHKREIPQEIDGITHVKPISFVYDQEEDIMYVDVIVKTNFSIRFTIPHPKEGEQIIYRNASFGAVPIADGLVTINRLDDWYHIISGTFAGGTMTEGRFDVIYDRK